MRNLRASTALGLVTLVASPGWLLAQDPPEETRTAWKKAYDEVQGLTTTGRFDEAIEKAQGALEATKSAFGEEDWRTLGICHQIGYAHMRVGRFDEAASVLEMCLESRRRVLRVDHLDTAATIQHLAFVRSSQGLYQEAESLYSEWYEWSERTRGAEDPQTLRGLSDLASARWNQGRYSDAEPLWERCLEARARVLGSEHQDTLDAMAQLSDARFRLGRLEEAGSLGERCLEIRRRILGTEDPLTTGTAAHLAGVRYAQGRYLDAEPLYRECYEWDRRKLGEDHPDTLAALHGIAVATSMQDRYADAEPLWTRCLEGRSRALGAEHPDTLTAAGELAHTRFRLGRLDEARALYEGCVEVRGRVLGVEHPDTLSTAVGFADLLLAQGHHVEAEPIVRRIYEARVRSLGPEDRDTLAARANLALILYSQGRAEEAAIVWKACLEVQTRVLGPAHTEVLATNSNLAASLITLGRPAEAESLTHDCLETCERALGSEHPITVRVRTRLAMIETLAGRIGEGEARLRKALDLAAAAKAGDDPETLRTLLALATALSVQGRVREAEPLFLRCLDGQTRTLGPESPYTLLTRSALGALYLGSDRFAEAERHFRECLEVQSRVLGSESPITLQSMIGLGSVLFVEDSLAEAEVLLAKALEVQTRVLGSDNLDTLASQFFLAWVYHRQGRCDEARPLYEDCLARRRRVLGPDHILTRQTAMNAAMLLAAHGEWEEAVPAVLEVARSHERWWTEFLPGLAAAGREWLADPGARSDWVLASLAVRDETRERSAAPALESVLSRKGLLVRIASGVERVAALRRSGDPTIAGLANELAEARSRISREALEHPVAGVDMRSREDEFVRLRARTATLEQELGLRVGRELRAVQTAEAALARIHRALPEDAALVEFMLYRPVVFESRWRFDSERYLAFVVSGRTRGRVHAVDLGPVAEIDDRIVRFRRAVQDPAGMRNPLVESRAREIHQAIWQPLGKALGSVDRVFVSPEGQLHLVPFEALRTPGGRFLVEELELRRIAGGLDLVSNPSNDSSKGSLVLSAPDYGDPTAEGGFLPLAGAMREADDVASELEAGGRGPVERLVAAEATEEALRGRCEARAPSILHIATHGFFLEIESPAAGPDPTAGTLSILRNPAALGARGSIDSLVRSGLALAGANRGPAEGESDGKLTALEVLGLPLARTELVVLSACDTGVGEVTNGEGIESLAAAFHRAGARNVLFTLWPVGDDSARRFLGAFYKRVLAGAEPSAALRNTQIEFLASGDPELAAPAAWAGFVLAESGFAAIQ